MSFSMIPGLLCDHEIEKLCQADNPMISPFSKNLSGTGVISHGLSSFGYDATCSNKFKIANTDKANVLDPKSLNPDTFVDVEGDYCILPPHGFALTHTNEYFIIPDNVLSICLAKSTYARVGVVVGVTPLEPGWEGQVTIEISNTTDHRVKIYANEGICQFLFFRGTHRPNVTYSDRKGKYMGQRGIVLPRILK